MKTIEQEPTVDQRSILGLQWCVSDDSLQVCRGTNKVIEGQITQRKILSLVSSVFDPLGLFAPFTVEMHKERPGVGQNGREIRVRGVLQMEERTPHPRQNQNTSVVL